MFPHFWQLTVCSVLPYIAQVFLSTLRPRICQIPYYIEPNELLMSFLHREGITPYESRSKRLLGGNKKSNSDWLEKSFERFKLKIESPPCTVIIPNRHLPNSNIWHICKYKGSFTQGDTAVCGRSIISFACGHWCLLCKEIFSWLFREEKNHFANNAQTHLWYIQKHSLLKLYD